MKKELPKSCQAAMNLNLQGNIIPNCWYSEIKFDSDSENPKTDLAAINILAEIIYWYRPYEIRDESTGKSIGHRKKFKADKYQISYRALGDKFGLTKDQTRRACKNLKRLNLIDIEFRDIKSNSTILRNVMFLEPNIREISLLDKVRNYEGVSNSNQTRIGLQSGGVSDSNQTRTPLESDTNTEISTEISTDKKENPEPKNGSQNDVSKKPKREKYPPESEWIRRANYCIDKIIKNHPRLENDLRKPHRIQSFAKVIHDCERLDGLTVDDIQKAIDFATSDFFWSQQFQSPKKLRDKSPKMDIKYIFAWLDKAENGNGSNGASKEVMDIFKQFNLWRRDFDLAVSKKPTHPEVIVLQRLLNDNDQEIVKQKYYNYLHSEDNFVAKSGFNLSLFEKQFSTIELNENYRYHINHGDT